MLPKIDGMTMPEEYPLSARRCDKRHLSVIGQSLRNTCCGPQQGRQSRSAPRQGRKTATGFFICARNLAQTARLSNCSVWVPAADRPQADRARAGWRGPPLATLSASALLEAERGTILLIRRSAVSPSEQRALIREQDFHFSVRFRANKCGERLCRGALIQASLDLDQGPGAESSNSRPKRGAVRWLNEWMAKFLPSNFR